MSWPGTVYGACGGHATSQRSASGGTHRRGAPSGSRRGRGAAAPPSGQWSSWCPEPAGAVAPLLPHPLPPPAAPKWPVTHHHNILCHTSHLEFHLRSNQRARLSQDYRFSKFFQQMKEIVGEIWHAPHLSLRLLDWLYFGEIDTLSVMYACLFSLLAWKIWFTSFFFKSMLLYLLIKFINN